GGMKIGGASSARGVGTTGKANRAWAISPPIKKSAGLVPIEPFGRPLSSPVKAGEKRKAFERVGEVLFVAIFESCIGLDGWFGLGVGRPRIVSSTCFGVGRAAFLGSMRLPSSSS